MKVTKQTVGCSLEEKGCSPDVKIYQTLDVMRRFARQDYDSSEINEIVLGIKSETGNKTLQAMKAFEFVVSNISYMYDHKDVVNFIDASELKSVLNTEFVKTPKRTLEFKRGDCDDMATLLASIYLALSIPVRFRIIAWKSREFSHVYPEAGLFDENGKAWWVPADPVIKTFGIEKNPDASNKHFFRAESVRIAL